MFAVPRALKRAAATAVRLPKLAPAPFARHLSAAAPAAPAVKPGSKGKVVLLYR